ncbi:MAG: tRNA pseudouridine(13) synthase TruD [Planctomycetota bacterium]|jgi:tRNA pseudouridine13 synthase|nr:tRNA pseudouridine(13) synthase TruD [Planctomycetota bacterium]
MLPRITADLPSLSGPLKLPPGSVSCEEQLLREPLATGDHWWLKCRVEGLSRKQLVAAVARAADVPVEVIGCAGGRDRKAVVQQWLSVPKELVDQPKRFRNAGYQKKMRVLETREGKGPIGPELVTGLRWRVQLAGHGNPAGFRTARAILDALRQRGCPNFFAARGASTDPSQIRWGRLVAQGKPLPQRVRQAGGDPRRSLLAFRNELFNRYLVARMADGLHLVRTGDQLEVGCNRPAAKREQAQAEDPAAYQARVDSYEAVPLGPLFGRSLVAVSGAAAELEQRVLAEVEVAASGFAALRGERRAVRIQPTSAQVEIERKNLTLRCMLPPDAHIGALLREFVVAREDEPSIPDEDGADEDGVDEFAD